MQTQGSENHLQTNELVLTPWNKQDQHENARHDFKQAAGIMIAKEIRARHRVVFLRGTPYQWSQEVTKDIGEQNIGDEPDAVARTFCVDSRRERNQNANTVYFTNRQKEHQPRRKRSSANQKFGDAALAVTVTCVERDSDRDQQNRHDDDDRAHLSGSSGG